MIIKIKKRDGRTVTFNIEKIAGAIYKAAQSVGKDNYEEALELSGKVVDKLMEKHLDMPTVEEIQDCVERVLIEEGMADTAKSYILYRSNRTRAREMNTRLMKVYEDLTFQSAKDNDLKRENANIDGDTAMGTMLKYGSVGAKEFNEMYVLAPEHSKAHQEGDIHIHDLDFYTLTTTCTQIDLTKLFDKGFSTGHAFLRGLYFFHCGFKCTFCHIRPKSCILYAQNSIPNKPGKCKQNTFCSALCFTFLSAVLHHVINCFTHVYFLHFF